MSNSNPAQSSLSHDIKRVGVLRLYVRPLLSVVSPGARLMHTMPADIYVMTLCPCGNPPIRTTSGALVYLGCPHHCPDPIAYAKAYADCADDGALSTQWDANLTKARSDGAIPWPEITDCVCGARAHLTRAEEHSPWNCSCTVCGDDGSQSILIGSGADESSAVLDWNRKIVEATMTKRLAKYCDGQLKVTQLSETLFEVEAPMRLRDNERDVEHCGVALGREFTAHFGYRMDAIAQFHSVGGNHWLTFAVDRVKGE